MSAESKSSVEDAPSPTFADIESSTEKMAVLNTLIQQALEKLCAHARDKNYLLPPYGRNIEPTPLITEEDFVNVGGLKADDTQPEFHYDYGFDALKFVADYLLWAHPDSVANREREKIAAQKVLVKRAEHAKHQLHIQDNLKHRVERLQAGIEWGPLVFPVASSVLRVAVKPFKHGLVYLQVSEQPDFSEITKTYKLFTKSLPKNSGTVTPADGTVTTVEEEPILPRFVDIDQLHEKRQYFIRAFAVVTDDCHPPPPPAPKVIPGKGKNAPPAAPSSSAPPVIKDYLELFPHDEEYTELITPSFVTLQNGYTSQCWTVPDEGLALLSAETAALMTQLKYNSHLPVNLQGGNGLIAEDSSKEKGHAMANLSFFGQFPLQTMQSLKSLGDIDHSITRSLQSLATYTVILGDLLLHKNIEEEGEMDELYRQYLQQAMYQVNKLLQLPETQQTSCLLAWRDNHPLSGLFLRQEEVAYKQYRHDLKKYNKKHGLDEKKKPTARKDPKKEALLASLPPPPVLKRPPPSPQLDAIAKAFPMPGTSSRELDDTSPNSASCRMLFRSIMIGAEIQLIVLDLRKSHSHSSLACDYLGKEQSEWLQYTLEQSQATWKIIASGKTFGLAAQGTEIVPITPPRSGTITPHGIDGSRPLSPLAGEHLLGTGESKKEKEIEEDLAALSLSHDDHGETTTNPASALRPATAPKPGSAGHTKSVQLIVPERDAALEEREKARQTQNLYEDSDDVFGRPKYSLQHVLATIQQKANGGGQGDERAERDRGVILLDSGNSNLPTGNSAEAWGKVLFVRSGIVLLTSGLTTTWTRFIPDPDASNVSSNAEIIVAPTSPSAAAAAAASGENNQQPAPSTVVSASASDSFAAETIGDVKDFVAPAFCAAYYDLHNTTYTDEGGKGRLPIDHQVDTSASAASIERRVPYCVELGLGSAEGLKDRSIKHGLEYLAGFEAEAHYIAPGPSEDDSSIESKAVTQCHLTLQDDGSLRVEYYKNILNVSGPEKQVIFDKVLVVPAITTDESDNQSGSIHVA